MGTWLLTSERNIPNMHRVLKTTGELGGGWSPAEDGLPTTAGGVHALLADEGVPFDPKTGRATRAPDGEVAAGDEFLRLIARGCDLTGLR